MEETGDSRGKVDLIAKAVYWLIGTFFLIYLIWYYITGLGGPTLLAIQMIPTAFIVYTFESLKDDQLYPNLSRPLNYLIAFVFTGLAIFVAVYFTIEFDAIRTFRVLNWNTLDFFAGGTIFILVMEFCRREYIELFVVNIFLMLYVVYGNFVPGMFHHAGMTWKRILTAMTLEMSTGVFARLPQIALTLISSFILVLSTLKAFGAIDSLLKAAKRIGAGSKYILPQSAVIGSMGVASISGSAAANSATTGSATIPTMIQAGISKLYAATIETASSIGGQLMPPVMGVAAFIMANFLGVGYFEVVFRGFVPAIIYFFGVSISVYLISARQISTEGATSVSIPSLDNYDKINLLAYLLVIVGLMYLMGYKFTAPMVAANTMFFWTGGILLLIYIWKAFRENNNLEEASKQILNPLKTFVDYAASMISDISLLLAVLAILTSAFTITGVPNTIGNILVNMAGVSKALLGLVGFFFGYIVGLGLPPSSTYIVTGVVLAPQLVIAGINPWAAHFFAFFMGVFSELSPPTSVSAAVTSRIADTNFQKTMIYSTRLCLPLLVLMGAVFARPHFLVEPGLSQLLPASLILIGTVGLMASFFGKYSKSRAFDFLLRFFIGSISLVTLLFPGKIVIVAMVITLASVIFGIIRTPKLAKTCSS